MPGPQEVPPSTNFFMTCLIIAFAVLMYALRPNSLRQLRNNTAKDRDNERVRSKPFDLMPYKFGNLIDDRIVISKTILLGFERWSSYTTTYSAIRSAIR